MKPRTKFHKVVAASNERLTALSPKALEWALNNVIEHIAFRTSGRKCTCGDCAHQFEHKGKSKYVRCPHCNRKQAIKDTLKRNDKVESYFSAIATIDGLQVQRVYILSVAFHKGKEMRMWYMEVCRLWLNANGQTAVTSRTRTIGYYLDSFNWASGIELRKETNVHWTIANTYVYPHYSVLPELRRNGLKGKLPNCHPLMLMKALLTDSRIETILKAKDHKAVEYFTCRPHELDRCWQSYKVARRNNYVPEDYEMWCDLIGLLERCGRDTHNAKYVCPIDLKWNMTGGSKRQTPWRNDAGRRSS